MAPTTVKGVVATAKGAPVEVRDIVVPDPGPGEARVTVQACGVCHTDLHYREGAINDEFPFLLGHEAAGVVESVGPDVTEVSPGDFVVLNWRAVCGECRACRRGRPWYCFNTHNATQKMTLTDGTELSPALGIGAFAEKTLVAAGQCTKVDPKAPATTVGLLGVPTPDMRLELPLIDVFGRGGALKSSWYGDCLPSRDFPMLVDLYLQGRLDLDRFVSEKIGLGDIEAAFEKMHRGEVLRSV